MDLAISDVQALALVVTCAALAMVAIALPLRWSGAAAFAAHVAFTVWTRSVSAVLAATVLLALALCVGTIVRLRQIRAVEAERTLAQSVATAEARREAAVLEERATLARELHDVLAHSLSALAIQLERVRLEVGALPGGCHAAEELAVAHRIVGRGLDDARGAVSALRGDRSAKIEDMARLVAEFRDATGIPTTLDVSTTNGEVGPAVGFILFRALQEALTNAARHARPSRIHASLTSTPGEVTLRVVNDGVDPARTPEPVGSGLQGLRERVALAGGNATAGVVDGRGYEVRVWLPT
jgi:signal transduction histidine kinase